MSASTNWDPALSAEQRHPPFTKLRHFPVRRRPDSVFGASE
nr:MAG TPA: hypothetical protein [Caudoviricetes sp.]